MEGRSDMSMIKNIYYIHHSHFDLGYTHPQELIEEFQVDYISQALELCEATKEEPETKKFRWTIEATLPLVKWLKDVTVEEIKVMKEAIARQQISVAGLPMHTTPLNDAVQMKQLMEYKKFIEKELNISIKTAINHDINGQPWSFADILLDAGIDFYLTGENIHFGGIPFERPKAFYWEAPSKRKLLSFLGEHYSLFSQFLMTDKRDIHLMRAGLEKYLVHLEEHHYDQDYILLTATNPPLLDNNPPDIRLLNLINEYNEYYQDHQIQMITTEMLRDKILLEKEDKPIEVKRGDWTDFWNFGAGSTPLELIVNKKAHNNLIQAEVLESFTKKDLSKHYKRVKQEAIKNNLIYNEHTWGAAESITQPDSEKTRSQKYKKATYAYDALAQSALVLTKAADSYLDIPQQLEEIQSISLTNTSQYTQTVYPTIDKDFIERKPYLSSFKSTFYLNQKQVVEANELVGEKTKVPPFSTVTIPLKELKIREVEDFASVDLDDSYISWETSFYRITLDKRTGKVSKLYHKESKWEIVQNENYGFFDIIEEQINIENNEAHRKTFFPRDIELANYSISVWNHKWDGIRKTITQPPEIEAIRYKDIIKIKTRYKNPLESVSYFEKSLIFNEETDEISIHVEIKRNGTNLPLSHYLSMPLNLHADWKSVYESADTLIELDEDQMGNVSKDWVTIGNSIAMFDTEKGAYVGSPDAPLVQFGEFNFGKESKKVERLKNPLFLSWIYNNYWDTNFNSSDDSYIMHDYVFKPFYKYNRADQIQLGKEVAKPLVINWSEISEHKLSKMLSIKEKNCVILSIEKKSVDEILVFIKNYATEEGTVSLSSEIFEFKQAYLSNLAGEKIKEIELDNQTLFVEIPANHFAYLSIKR